MYWLLHARSVARMSAVISARSVSACSRELGHAPGVSLISLSASLTCMRSWTEASVYWSET